MVRCIQADALTTFDIAPDGERVRLNVRDQTGSPAALELPTLCLNQMLMTLPRIIQSALRTARNDETLRLVHALDQFGLEIGEPDAQGERRFILTLKTAGGFSVPFAFTESQLGALVQSIVDDALEPASVDLPVALNS